MRDYFVQYKDKIDSMLRYATLRADILFEPGLDNGKMGMSILFYEYSHFYDDCLYREYADELLDSVLLCLNTDSFGIEKGLSGIAWGITYLFDRDYIRGNISDVLSEIDLSLLNNLELDKRSILTYFAYRKTVFDDIFPSEVEYNLNQLISICKNMLYSQKYIKDVIWNNWNMMRLYK